MSKKKQSRSQSDVSGRQLAPRPVLRTLPGGIKIYEAAKAVRDAAEMPTPTSSMHLVCIDREAAMKNLDEFFTRNRNLGDDYARDLAKKMVGNEWKDTGAPIVFDTDGMAIDGKNRMKGVVKADKPIWFWVCAGVPKDAVYSIDRGRLRTLAHAYAWGFEKLPKNAQTIGAAAILLRCLYEGRNLAPGSVKFDIESMVDFTLKHPNLVKSVEVAYKMRKWAQPSGLSVLHYLFSKIDPGFTTGFFQHFDEGRNLSKDDVIAKARDAIIEERGTLTTTASSPGTRKQKGTVYRGSRPYQMAVIIKAWNAYVNEVPIKGAIDWNSAYEPFPVICGAGYEEPFSGVIPRNESPAYKKRAAQEALQAVRAVGKVFKP